MARKKVKSTELNVFKGREALTKPNATVIGREKLEEHQLHQLSIALKQQLLREMREEQNAGRTTQ